mmetsp:Transcript_8185/g.12318  ORF Transcript_8185/g.12318 Transcript_8185/m.12318 type:complete len:245 (+) Transcript_8185:222-956(+)
MKSSTIFTALTTVALVPVTHGIQSRLPFAATPTGSLLQHPKLLLHVRGGEQIITPDEGVETVVGTEMGEDGVVTDGMVEEGAMLEEGAMVEETPTAPISKEVIMSMLLPIKSAIQNMGIFYINSLNSYPVQTITLTAIAVVLLVSIVASLLGSKNEEVEVSTIVEPQHVPAPKPKVTTSSPASTPPTPSGVGSRGLITGLGTAAATTFAIYQAVSRPPSEDESDDFEEDESEAEEHASTVFKGV